MEPIMSSAWDINLDLNSIVETSDDSDAVNGHRDTWSLRNDFDLAVDTWVCSIPNYFFRVIQLINSRRPIFRSIVAQQRQMMYTR